MPILTANGTVLMGIGCGQVSVDGVVPAPLRNEPCTGGIALLSANVIMYQLCTTGVDGLEVCHLESLDLGTGVQTTLSDAPAGANFICANGQGDWAVWRAERGLANGLYYDSLGRQMTGPVPKSADDISGNWIAVRNRQTGTGLQLLTPSGSSQIITSDTVEDAWIRNNIVLYARGGLVYSWPDGVTSKLAVDGVRHSGTGWVVAWAPTLNQMVVYEHGASVVYPISGDEHDFNADIISLGGSRLLVASSFGQGERSTDIRRYVIDTVALTVERLHLDPSASGYLQSIVATTVPQRTERIYQTSPTGNETIRFTAPTQSTDPKTGGTPGRRSSGHAGPPEGWTPPADVQPFLTREYLVPVITAAWARIYNTQISDSELEKWIGYATHPDLYSDNVWRIGWNRYFEARMAPGGSASADPRLAQGPGEPGYLGPESELQWGSGGYAGGGYGDGSTDDDYQPTTAVAEPLSSKASRGITAQLGLLEEDILYNLSLLAVNVLEPIRRVSPSIRVISGFRQVNNGISQHEKGEAADIQLPAGTPEQHYALAQYISQNLQFDQLVLNYSPTDATPWIHVSFTASTLRREVLTRDYDDTFHSGLYLITPLTGEARAAALREQQEYIASITEELSDMAIREEKLNPPTILGDVLVETFASETGEDTTWNTDGQHLPKGSSPNPSFNCGVPAIVPEFFATVMSVFDAGNPQTGKPWRMGILLGEYGEFVEAVVAALPEEWGIDYDIEKKAPALIINGHSGDSILYRSPVPLYNGNRYQRVFVLADAGTPEVKPIWIPTCAPFGT